MLKVQENVLMGLRIVRKKLQMFQDIIKLWIDISVLIYSIAAVEALDEWQQEFGWYGPQNTAIVFHDAELSKHFFLLTQIIT